MDLNRLVHQIVEQAIRAPKPPVEGNKRTGAIDGGDTTLNDEKPKQHDTAVAGMGDSSRPIN